VWVHLRSEDGHDLGFDLGVGEGFYPVREIALWDWCSGGELRVMHLKVVEESHTVTVAKRIPDPGKRSGWSKLCHIGYLPRSASA